jgi:hypothetical protein
MSLILTVAKLCKIHVLALRRFLIDKVMVDRLLYALLLLIVLSDLGTWEDCECSLLHFLIYFIVQSSPICVRLTATSTTNGVSFN